MNIPVSVDVRLLSKDELMKTYEPEEVLGYCHACDNFEKNHSCPVFSFETKDYLQDYNYAFVIMTTIESKIIEEQKEALAAKHYPSQVYENYLRTATDDQKDFNMMVSMYAFNTIKDEVTERLLRLENIFEGTLSLPPGSCTYCSLCSKQLGKECVRLKDLRYSLEALGFLVSSIYDRVFGKSLTWVEDGLPETFDTCSVLMSKEKLEVNEVSEALGKLTLKL